VVYTITVSNSGPQDAQSVTLSDALPYETTLVSQSQTSGPTFTLSTSGNGVSDTIATLSAGSTAVFSVTAQVSSGASGGATLTDRATATGTNALEGAAAVTTNVPNASSTLGATISGPAAAVAGSQVVYTITVSNTGTYDANNLSLSDLMPVGLTVVSQEQTSGPTFTLSSSQSSIMDSIATLPAGASAGFSLTCLVGTQESNNAALTNSVEASSSGSSADAATTLNVQDLALLAVSATGPATAPAGQQITYTISVTNNGPQDAQQVTLSDPLPSGLTLVSQEQTSGPAFTLGSSGNSIANTIATLPAGSTAVFQVTALVG
jgi:uncharacterized repeat protein (TIGR01451 family)